MVDAKAIADKYIQRNGEPLPPLEAPELGERMLALRDDRQRRFAWLVACGIEPTDAARDAGYADPGPHSASVRVRAFHLIRSQKVLDAVEECAQLIMKGMGPIAVRAAHAILADPEHKFHAKMVLSILDRTGFAPKTEHTVNVKHTVDTKEIEALANRLAAESGIDPRKLLGGDAKIIDVIPEVVSD